MIFKLFNQLYHSAFWLYRPCYNLYKTVSDKQRIAKVKEVIKQGDTVIDIGANIGFYTEIMAKAVGSKGKVLSFEPDRTNFKHLSSIAKKFPQVEIYNLAVGDETKEVKLFSSPDFNVDHHTYDDGEGRASVTIDQVRLDEFIKDENIQFVKIDIQGFDFHAIKGMEGIFKSSESMSILGELWPYGLKNAGVDYMESLLFLEKYNFKCELYTKESRKELAGYLDEEKYYTDFFASRSN